MTQSHFFDVEHFTERCPKFMQFTQETKAVMTPCDGAYKDMAEKKMQSKVTPFLALCHAVYIM
jgi:hypothetical protein